MSAPSLNDLSVFRHWVAWQVETEKGKPRKIPINPANGRRAEVPTNPSTWSNRQQAERRWHGIEHANSAMVGGIGFVLGDIGFGVAVAGIDLDGVLDGDAITDDVAREVVKRFDTYGEVSPSGEGVKLFYQARAEDIAAICAKHSVNQRKTFTIGEGREIAIDFGRFYTVTQKRFGKHRTLRLVSRDDLEWLITVAGPRYVGAHSKDDSSSERDESGSGYGRRFFHERKNATYEEAREAILGWRGRAGVWARRVLKDPEKGERELERAWEQRDLIERRSENAANTTLEVVRGDQIEPKRLIWLWPDRFARGKIALLAGEQEEGKSQIALDIAARGSRQGNKWPSGEPIEQFDTIMLTHEDDLEDTVIPRFMAAGGDRSRIHFVKMAKDADGNSNMFTLNEDLKLLDGLIDRLTNEDRNVGLVVIDPITAYLGVGKIDAYRTTDVRGVLAPFQEPDQPKEIRLDLHHPLQQEH